MSARGGVCPGGGGGVSTGGRGCLGRHRALEQLKFRDTLDTHKTLI